VPWIAFVLLIFWCALEAAIFTYTLMPTVTELLVDLVGGESTARYTGPILYFFLLLLVMGSFAAVAISLRDGLRVIPPLYPRAGLMLGAKGWRLYRYVLLPASLPAMATSLRQGFSFAWRSLMGAELILVVSTTGWGSSSSPGATSRMSPRSSR